MENSENEKRKKLQTASEFVNIHDKNDDKLVKKNAGEVTLG